MFRVLFVCLLAIYITVPSLATPTLPPSGKDLSIVGFDDSQDDMLELEPNQTNRMGKFGSVLGVIKSQFKEILEELLLQAFKYVKGIIQHMKVKLLKKLGMYTISDVFDSMVGGVVEFMTSPIEEELVIEDSRPIPIRPSYGYSDGYALASLFGSVRR